MEKINTITSIPDCNFRQLADLAQIRIPKIQRDYAQGRKNDRVNDIRDKFVHSLISAIKVGSPLEMDFIYGSNEDDAFEPLDGQQRLTTLFLLHWMMGVDLKKAGTEKPVLTYETRNTSKEFCTELVKHDADKFRDEVVKRRDYKNQCIATAENKIKAANDNSEELTDAEKEETLKAAKQELNEAKAIHIPSISELIQRRDWFDYLWQYDPTIQSMLVMIDSIYKEMDWSLDLSVCRDNLDKITFSYLNLEAFGLSDELFIKMNARGKQLSTYDIMKSTLEEEIQVQIQEGHSNSTIEADWRAIVDGAWIDWFWNKYAAPNINDISVDENADEKEAEKAYKDRLNYAKTCEDKLKRLILRTIALDFQIRGTNDQELDRISYEDTSDNIDRIMTVYQDSLKKARSDGAVPAKEALIDFNEVMKNISCLYFNPDQDEYQGVLDLLPQNVSTRSNGETCFELFLSDSNPNDNKIIFYAIRSYLRENPIRLVDSAGNPADKGTPEKSWMDDFVYWAHACRNIFINENNNTRIDDPASFKNAISGVKELINALKAFWQDTAITDKKIVNFFATITYSNIGGIDNQSMLEEKTKASLRIHDSAWDSILNEVEGHPYLWGQIRCLTNWAGSDMALFNDYKSKLLDLLGADDKNLAYCGLMCTYPGYGFETEEMFRFDDKSRDYSIKRYLRDESYKNRPGVYAPAFKALIDTWRTGYGSFHVNDFLDQLRKEESMKRDGYLKCILSRPDMLSWAMFKMMYQHKGHYILASKKRRSSHCYDIGILYLFLKMSEDGKRFRKESLHHYDSVGVAHQYALSFVYKENKYLVQQVQNGSYELYHKEVLVKSLADINELLEYFMCNFRIR